MDFRNFEPMDIFFFSVSPFTQLNRINQDFTRVYCTMNSEHIHNTS